MRLNFTLSPNIKPVKFDYQHYLIGTFHKWLGANNELHNNVSLYSLGWLGGGRAVNGALQFERGANWFISAHDEKLLQTIVGNAIVDDAVFGGMRVVEIRQQATPNFGTKFTFRAGSPIVARKTVENGKQPVHLTFNEPEEASEILTKTLQRKMEIAGFNEEQKKVTVSFDESYRGAKTKMVRIKDVMTRASSCPVVVEGTAEAVAFAWNVGIGHGTGSGFGSLMEI